MLDRSASRPIDFPTPDADEGFLESALAAPAGSIVAAGPLVYLKLEAFRMQDKADVVALVKESLDVDGCRTYLEENAPDMVARFDALVEIAGSEQAPPSTTSRSR